MIRRQTLLLFVTALLSAEAWLEYDKVQKEASSSCGLYMAHSEIFDQLGVFTAHGLDSGTSLSSYDVIVPLMEENGPIWTQADWSHLLGYVEYEGRPVRAMLAGAGSAVNLHATLNNVVPSMATRRPDSSGLHRGNDAGVGAFSYHLMQYDVTAPVPPGGQILLNNVAPIDSLKKEDLEDMDNLVKEIQDIFKESDADDDVLNDAIRFIHSGLSYPVADSFPSNLDQFKRAVASGVSNSWSSEDLQVSVPWLKENGVCLDNVVPGSSELDQAGRGGFAKRSIKKGSIVAPSPVIPVSRFDLSNDREDEHQLLMNYCFGHPFSSVLLCQYGSPSAYINHGSGEKTNVKLQWSTKLSSDHEKLTNMTVKEVLTNPDAGLVLEVVAIKDIQAGEEIYLDYGSVWEEAWKGHLKHWETPPLSSSYTSADEWNAEDEPELRTEVEQMTVPYPENLYIGISYSHDPADPALSTEHDGGRAKLTMQWEPRLAHSQGARRPVYILDRQEGGDGGQDTYTVQIDNHPSTRDWDVDYINPDTVVILTGVPRNALQFVDKLFTTDMHLPDVFRNEMHVPLELYPLNWLDMVPSGEIEQLSKANYFGKSVSSST